MVDQGVVAEGTAELGNSLEPEEATVKFFLGRLGAGRELPLQLLGRSNADAQEAHVLVHHRGLVGAVATSCELVL